MNVNASLGSGIFPDVFKQSPVGRTLLLKDTEVYAYSEEDINSFYNAVDETLWKPYHYTKQWEISTCKYGKEQTLCKRQRENVGSK